MKKILTNEKLTKFIYYGLMSILILLIIINTKLDNMDEIWNFSHAKGIASGLVPYKDISIIVTPISMYINSLLLRINSSLLTFRVLYFIYYVILIYLLDKLCDLLKIKVLVKYVLIFWITMLLVKQCYLDYNFMQLILIILLIYLTLRNEDYKNKKLNVIIPLLSSIAILNKQSTGLVVAAVHIVLMLFNKFYLKKDVSYRFIIKQILLIILPVILFILYLVLLGAFLDFYDLAIAGLKTFSNNYHDSQLLFSLIAFYLIMFIILTMYKKDYNLWVIFLYGLASLSVVIPIVDIVHATLAIMIPLLFLGFLGSNIIRDFNGNYIYLLIPILIFLIISKIVSYAKANKFDNGIYKNIPVTTKLETKINVLSKYISDNKNVYIMNYTSTIYDLNCGKYHKYFDLFMNGNFGVKGTDKIYKMIDDEEQVFLISQTNDNWQTPHNIIDYVKEKYRICGSVSNFEMYCKK